jgi:His/Glu/Gln/Arg/opine family amino acid ABC transporter permease subunit
MTIQQIFEAHGEAFAQGLKVSLQLALIIWGIGIFFGTLLGAAGARWRWFVGAPTRTISVLLAGMPALVFLFWMHYPLQSLLGIVVKPFITAALTLSIINVFLVAEHCRGAINDFPTQYTWAARVCGLSEADTVLRIKLPILLRQILPGLLLIQITMLQATLFASLISVDEIFRAAQRVNSLVFRPVEIYTMLALAFIAVCVPLHLLAHYLRRRFTRDISER